MSDATSFTPVVQSASQLSENIGDVLASIRRLIAQDEAAETAAAAAPRPVAAPRPPVEAPGRVPMPDVLSRRRDILAEAQALTRRSEAAFGRAGDAAPLTLGPAERVAPLSPGALAATAVLSVTPPTAEANGPVVLTARAAVAARASTAPVPTGSEDAPGSIQAGEVPATDAPITQSPSPVATAAATDAKAAAMTPSNPPATSVLWQPATPTLSPPPANDAAPAAPTPVAETAFVPEEEDCTASILREMIRDVVRQELTGDPAGRMTGNLRSMIMREVAQVLTKGTR